MDFQEEQNNEVEALESIYPEEFECKICAKVQCFCFMFLNIASKKNVSDYNIFKKQIKSKLNQPSLCELSFAQKF